MAEESIFVTTDEMKVLNDLADEAQLDTVFFIHCSFLKRKTINPIITAIKANVPRNSIISGTVKLIKNPIEL